ncbi:MAG TPA: hypothetical protein VHZ54_10125 [Solirubrobacterales bacterium]|nr:hypothetical protein [Solirubrobacterales bacterium]
MLRRTIAVVAVLVAVVALPATTGAAEITRVEYREAAEPICKEDTQANERILAGVRTEVRHGDLGPPAAKFAKAAKALKQTLRELEALPRPAADEARLAKWFATVKTAVSNFEAISRKLKAGQKAAAESYVTKLTVTANKANNQVLPFEFTYCRFEPSRFT